MFGRRGGGALRRGHDEWGRVPVVFSGVITGVKGGVIPNSRYNLRSFFKTSSIFFGKLALGA